MELGNIDCILIRQKRLYESLLALSSKALRTAWKQCYLRRVMNWSVGLFKILYSTHVEINRPMHE